MSSGDLRCFKGKKERVKPISIRIDRFGRIAFNKNKELSQASFEKSEKDGMAAKSSSSNEEFKGQ
jgi:RIO-like serine/threonine protein kinase